jgi:hypothetical protein
MKAFPQKLTITRNSDISFKVLQESLWDGKATESWIDLQIVHDFQQRFHLFLEEGLKSTQDETPPE